MGKRSKLRAPTGKQGTIEALSRWEVLGGKGLLCGNNPLLLPIVLHRHSGVYGRTKCGRRSGERSSSVRFRVRVLASSGFVSSRQGHMTRASK